MVNLFFITYMNNFTITCYLVYNADAIHQSQDNYLTDNHIQDYDTWGSDMWVLCDMLGYEPIPVQLS